MKEVPLTWITRGVPHILLRQVEEEMKGSDRATAIVGGAFVDDHLTDSLKSNMVRNERLTEKMFSPGQIFGDFGAKIHFGYLIGIYSERAHDELTTIRRIRNEFAHQLELNSFERQGIRDRCQRLTLSQSKIVKAIRGEDGHSLVLTLGETQREHDEEIPLSDLFLVVQSIQIRFSGP
jgi:hypothetical protein